jgi:DNA-binding transcriptional regulator LsrR (DeoR family)
MVDALHTLPKKPGVRVVQILGGVGNPSAEVHATHLTSRRAALVKGERIFLPAPGVVGSEAAKRVLLEYEYVSKSPALFDGVTMALVGIGAVQSSALLAESGNIFSSQEQDILVQKRAVGDVLLRFFDHQGKPINSELDKRVISKSLDQLRELDRAIDIAGSRWQP